VIREALAPEASDASADEPDPSTATEPDSLWKGVDVATAWETGDLARQAPFDGSPVCIVVAATADSFGDLVLRVRKITDPRDDRADEEIPIEVVHIDRGELVTWRRMPKAARA
jgi:hypothetical protein